MPTVPISVCRVPGNRRTQGSLKHTTRWSEVLGLAFELLTRRSTVTLRTLGQANPTQDERPRSQWRCCLRAHPFKAGEPVTFGFLRPLLVTGTYSARITC